MNPIDEDNQPLLEEMQALRARVAELESAEANHKHLEEMLRRQSHDLGERVKELNCLFGISYIVELMGSSLEGTLQGIVELIPPSWQYPEITCARISLDGQKIFQTQNFEKTDWSQVAEIIVDKKHVGQIEVFYLEKRPESDEGPFFEEERRLIDAMAERLGRIIARHRAETERTELREQLHQAQKMEAIGQLAGGVAHDFNNLITVIRGHCDQLRKATTADRQASESLDIIDETVEQASSMTRSLLAFTRKLPTERCILDLRTAIDTAIRMLRRMLPDSIELRADRACDEPIHVMGDRVQLQQVVLNLAINARDAMPNGGVLCISLFPCAATEIGPSADTPGSQACFARIEVSDTGTGMSPDTQDRIFEPFFTTKTREQGTGLGLSITYGIIKDHGGRIDVQSEVDRGTTFSLTLPCVDPDSLQAPATPTMPERQGTGELILLAEDHRYVRNIMTNALRSLGYEVISAENGPALLDHYERHRSESRLVVLDVDLPGRSGLDCLRAIREETASLPIILVTGNIDPDIESQVDAGTVLLHKPFQVAELARLVSHMIADPSQEDESS